MPVLGGDFERVQRLVELEENRVFQAEQLLTAAECAALMNHAEDAGFKRSPVSGGGHGRTGREEPRNNSFVVIEDQELADALWRRIKGVVPKDLSFLSSSPYFEGIEGAGEKWRAVGVVDRLRFYRYERGQSYPEHMDGSYRRTITTEEGKRYLQQSFLTLLCYLNDDFTGGETQFFPDHQHCRFLREIETKIPTLEVTPRTGNALINVHHILHQGKEVCRGVKYVLRTDILFERERASHPKLERFEREKRAGGTLLAPNKSEWERIFEPSCKAYHD